MSAEDTNDLEFLSTVDGEIAFFRAIMRARPVGIHRHFHILNIRNGILKDTGHAVSVQAVWDKLRGLYDMDALEAIDLEIDGYESRTSENSTPISIRSPSPSENLAAHPFFRDEYALPYDPKVEEIITQRRMRDTPSPISLAPTPPPVTGRTRASGRAKRGKSKLDLAGLVGGDSDSSALTQESGDEGPPTPRDSATITEGGTEYGGDEDAEMHDVSPDPSAASPRGTRKKPPKKAATTTAKTRGGGATAGRATKKKKK